MQIFSASSFVLLKTIKCIYINNALKDDYVILPRALRVKFLFCRTANETNPQDLITKDFY